MDQQNSAVTKATENHPIPNMWASSQKYLFNIKDLQQKICIEKFRSTIRKKLSHK